MIAMNDFTAEPPVLRTMMLNAAKRVIESGWFILGNEVANFEKQWADNCGVAYGVGVGNGMDAIEIALRSIGVGPGDEIITTPMTAFATVLAILRAGATPVLADIDTSSALMSVDSANRCVTPSTKAIVLVHLYGQVRRMGDWVSFCFRHNIALVEDCAQAHGSSWRGQFAGSFGVAGAYSFYPTKNLGALGDAGMIVPPDVQPQVDGVWEKLVTADDPASHSINDNVTRDGRRITCEWRNTPWRDGSGQIRGILSIVSDITEKKQAAEKFAREQARFKLIFDTVPVGIAFHTVHPDGRFTRTINDAHLRICGLTREQHDQPGIYAQITHPEDHALQQRFIAQVNAGVRKHYSMEKRYLHPDGKVVWVDFSYQREIYPDGTIEELTTVVDITERKTVEQQLMQLAVIVESSEDAIISKTLDGIITSWNRGAEIIFGHPASETLGRPMLMLFPDELKYEEADILARIACGESVEHFETERLRKDGTRLRVSATISPLKNAQGEIVGA